MRTLFARYCTWLVVWRWRARSPPAYCLTRQWARAACERMEMHTIRVQLGTTITDLFTISGAVKGRLPWAILGVKLRRQVCTPYYFQLRRAFGMPIHTKIIRTKRPSAYLGVHAELRKDRRLSVAYPGRACLLAKLSTLLDRRQDWCLFIRCHG